MKRFLYFFTILFLGACTTSKHNVGKSNTAVQSHIDAVRQQWAPDKRTVLFTVSNNGPVLIGETNTSQAKTALLQRLQSAGITYIDSILVLPQPALEGKHHGVITISVANLRTQPRHPAELSTQATLGTHVKVWKKEKGWYYVQTPDAYLAWVDASAIQLMNDAEYATWQQQPKLLYTQPFGFSYASPDLESATVSDLVYGAMMTVQKENEKFYEVRFPDGRQGFIPKSESTPYDQWRNSRQPTRDNLVQTAKRLMGIPYLWGGTSFKGVDCSGFTKTVYFMNGLVLPRDASQQVQIGAPVDTVNNWQALQPGDLLFFGSPAKEGTPERVVHVGMWIGGNAEFIHSAGRVQVSSLNPAAPNYNAFEHQRLLRVKRIEPSAALMDLRYAAF